MLSSVTVGLMVFVDMTTSCIRSQCYFLEKWKLGRRKTSRSTIVLTHALGNPKQGQNREELLRNLDVLAMSTDFKSGELESAGRAVGYVGMEAFGESGGVEEKRPKQSSGHVVRR